MSQDIGAKSVYYTVYRSYVGNYDNFFVSVVTACCSESSQHTYMYVLMLCTF